MSKRSNASRSTRGLSPIREDDDEEFDNVPNVLSDKCMTKIDERIEWVIYFCDKAMAKDKDRKPSSEEDLKEDDSESDIRAGEAPEDSTKKLVRLLRPLVFQPRIVV